MSTVLHVGFHRTGTTMLQRSFFPMLPDCVVVGPGMPYFRKFHRRALELCRDHDADYSDASLLELFGSKRREAGTLIVSLETFSQHHAEGRTAARLQALLPDAKVLICVRDQRTALISRFGLHVKHGGVLTLGRYADAVEESLHYDVVVGSYLECFGTDQVKVLAYELLVSDRARFLSEIHSFIFPQAVAFDVPEVPVVNRSMSPPIRWCVRKANRLFVEGPDNTRPPLVRFRGGTFVTDKLKGLDRVLFEQGKLVRVERVLAGIDHFQADRFAARFATSNARLQALTGINLEAYGYCVGRG